MSKKKPPKFETTMTEDERSIIGEKRFSIVIDVYKHGYQYSLQNIKDGETEKEDIIKYLELVKMEHYVNILKTREAAPKKTVKKKK